ncbi:MAG: hypothetical protein ACOYEG_07115 [Petrimonas sp.]|jgi:hypothetical protein
MKKQVIPVFSFLLLLFMGGALPCSSLKAQDFLVTIQRDTLNCKIGKMEGDFYTIEFKWDDELMQGTIHKDSILYFKRNMFRSINDNRLRPWYPLVHFSLNVGGGQQFGPLRVGLTENNTPKKGTASDRGAFYVGADLAAYLSALTGYGLKYHYRHMLGGDIQQNYVGPMISLRFWDDQRKNHWVIQGSVGYGRMVHNNAMIKIGTRQPEPIKLTANTVAGDVGVGYNLKLSRKFSALVKLSATVAYPKFVRIFDYTRINPTGADPTPDISGYCHNMNSVNLTVGLAVH